MLFPSTHARAVVLLIVTMSAFRGMRSRAVVAQVDVAVAQEHQRVVGRPCRPRWYPGSSAKFASFAGVM